MAWLVKTVRFSDEEKTMYGMWMFIYLCFFPAAYLGWIGMLGTEAKRAANRFFDYVGYVIILSGILLLVDIFFPDLTVYVKAFAAWIVGI